MTELSATEWIVYGFTLTGYILGFVVIGNFLMFLGFGMVGSIEAIGAVGSSGWTGAFTGLALMMLGWLLMVAAFAGALYKITVDGVSRGMQAHV